MLTATEAVEQVQNLLKFRDAEAPRLQKIHTYLRGEQSLPTIPSGTPSEVHSLARMSRVNLMRLVIDVFSQSLYVDGYRRERASDDAPAWAIWQANKMDARQTGIHRAALAYGASYTIVTPGDPVPVIRGASPRTMTAVYGEDDEWPEWALHAVAKDTYHLYDGEARYRVVRRDGALQLDGDPGAHEAGVVPVVRYPNVLDLDGEVVGEIEPLIPLQDQLDTTTFGLLVAQHFAAFRQRYIMGWTAETENQLVQASAALLMTFDDDDVKVGEFGQTDLSGYLDSRGSSTELLATISQVPPHHLLGKMVNLSAEALAAAEAGKFRKLAERENLFGEAHEQTLALAQVLAGGDVDDGAQVKWRDTEARSLAQMADALGKLSQMLGVPPQALWEKIPGVSQQDVERWKAMAAEADVLGRLEASLERQMATAAPEAAEVT